MDHVTHAIQLTRTASEHPGVFARAFSSGDPGLLDQVYAPGAVFVTADGQHLSGAQRVAANTEFQALGVPISVRVEQVHEYGDDLALLVVTWRISGFSATAQQQVEIAGTATDVVQRGSDGYWRYVIDCPFGTATAPRPAA